MITFQYKLIFFIGIIFITSCDFSQKKDKETSNTNYELAFNKCEHLDLRESLDCMIGIEMPNFKAKTISGKLVSSKSLQNKVVVLNFWATHCRPCIAEMPGLNDIATMYKDKDVEFISVANNTKESLNSFFKKHTFLFETIADHNELIGKEIFKNKWGFPLTIIFNKKGNIHKMFCGGLIDETAPEHIKKTLIPEIEDIL